MKFVSRSTAAPPRPRSDDRRDLPAWFKAAVPLTGQLDHYRRGWLAHDVVAGLAIAAVALPTAVAYPEIAGLPPAVGLYASILPLLAYAIFGSSRQLIVGPDAVTLSILGASLSQLRGISVRHPPDTHSGAVICRLPIGGHVRSKPGGMARSIHSRHRPVHSQSGRRRR